MKNKILGLPKAAVIVIGIVITALFLVLMNLVGGVVAHLTSITDSYTLQLIAEIGVAIYAIGMLFLMGYQQSLKKTGVGFLRGFYIGGFMVGYCVYVAVAQLFLQSVSGSDGVRSAGGIMIYILTMFLVDRIDPVCGIPLLFARIHIGVRCTVDNDIRSLRTNQRKDSIHIGNIERHNAFTFRNICIDKGNILTFIFLSDGTP